MENQTQTQSDKRGLEHWENELRYFETTQEALKVCYGIISDLKAHAQMKYEELLPDRQEVENES